MASITRVQVELRAFRIWQEAGCPEGSSLEHWLQAERELDVIPEALERDLIGTLHGYAADVAEEQHTVGYFPEHDPHRPLAPPCAKNGPAELITY